MTKYSTTVGMDLGDKMNRYCVLNEAGDVVRRGEVKCTKVGLRKLFGSMGPCLVAIEAGAHSPWVSALLESLGHEVLVGNPRQLPLITRNDVKTDERDAELLARIARLDPSMLRPIHHRGHQAQMDLSVLKARDSLVQVRGKLIKQVRSLVKGIGERLPKCSTESFCVKVTELPEELKPALAPLMEVIEDLTKKIREYETRIERICEERYPETEVVRTVQGVGAVTGLAFVLTLEDPHRFAKSRRVGAYLGLTPKKKQSGASDPQLRITKAGNTYTRRLLVQSAQYMLGPFAQDSALRDWGLKLQARGGKYAKKRAVVAVARKLAVLLHRMWVSGECWRAYPEPLPAQRRAA